MYEHRSAVAPSPFSHSFFALLLLFFFVLACSCSSQSSSSLSWVSPVAADPAINFLPPLCSSNITKYGPLVQTVSSISLQVTYCVLVQISEDEFTDNCTNTNNTFAPIPDHTLDPAVSSYFAELWRFNPDDELSGQIQFNFNMSAIPSSMQGVSIAYGQVDTTNSSLDIDWETINDVWDSVTMYTFFGQFNQIHLIPDPLDERKPMYSYSYLLLAPQVSEFWPFQSLWNESCAIAFTARSNCCMEKQPPILVLQPYWILLLSTCVYFVAGYAYVYLLINLEKLACWRRCIQTIKEHLDIAAIKPWRLRSDEMIAPPPSSVDPADAVSPRNDSPSDEDKAHISSSQVHSTSVHTARENELRDVDDELRRSFKQDYLTPLIDPADAQFHDFGSSASLPAAGEAAIAAADEVSLQNVSQTNSAQVTPATPVPSSSTRRKSISALNTASESESVLTISERVTRANGTYLLLQLLIVFCNFFYINIRISVLDNAPQDQSKSTWWRYQQVYMFWTNSSMVTLLASALASHVLMKYQYYKTLQLQRPAADNEEEQEQMEGQTCRKCYTCGCCCMCCRSRWVKLKLFYRVELPKEKLVCRHIACAVLFVFSPAIITHVIPMWILFFPFLLLAIAILTFIVSIVFAVFYLTDVSADRAYDSMKEMYASRNRKKQRQAHLLSSEADSPSNNEDASTVSSSSAADSPTPPVKESINPLPPVTFPWYAILLLRLLFTITIVVFFQTSYNYGQLIYTYIWPVRNEINLGHDGYYILYLWGEPAVFEFAMRNTDQWYEGLQSSMHQYLTQLSFFV